jgi:hypothetical protein
MGGFCLLASERPRGIGRGGRVKLLSFLVRYFHRSLFCFLRRYLMHWAFWDYTNLSFFLLLLISHFRPSLLFLCVIDVRATEGTCKLNLFIGLQLGIGCTHGAPGNETTRPKEGLEWNW